MIRYYTYLEHWNHGLEIWMQRKLDWKYLKSLKMWCWRRMEKIKWPEKITNERFIKCIGDNRTLLNNILCRKANLIGHNLRKKVLSPWCHWRAGDWSDTLALSVSNLVTPPHDSPPWLPWLPPEVNGHSVNYRVMCGQHVASPSLRLSRQNLATCLFLLCSY